MYVATVKFPVSRPTSPQMQTQLQDIIARSSTLKDPSSVRVSVDDGGVVILRGEVSDDDERRLAENLLRLTPGVRQLRNEIQVKATP